MVEFASRSRNRLHAGRDDARSYRVFDVAGSQPVRLERIDHLQLSISPLPTPFIHSQMLHLTLTPCVTLT